MTERWCMYTYDLMRVSTCDETLIPAFVIGGIVGAVVTAIVSAIVFYKELKCQNQ